MTYTYVELEQIRLDLQRVGIDRPAMDDLLDVLRIAEAHAER